MPNANKNQKKKNPNQKNTTKIEENVNSKRAEVMLMSMDSKQDHIDTGDVSIVNQQQNEKAESNMSKLESQPIVSNKRSSSAKSTGRTEESDRTVKTTVVKPASGKKHGHQSPKKEIITKEKTSKGEGNDTILKASNNNEKKVNIENASINSRQPVDNNNKLVNPVKKVDNKNLKDLSDGELVNNVVVVENENREDFSNERHVVSNVGALAKKRWSKISTKELLPGSTHNITGKLMTNGISANETQDGSLSVPHADDRTADTKSLLSVTSGARRGSMESRRSIDFGTRTGLMQATVINPPGTETEKPRSVVSNDDSFIRNAIPFLPLPIAVVCLLLNIFVPGFGTFLSGVCIFCCGKTRVHSKDDHKAVTLCVNTWVGLCQLFTITLCLVGWFWSISWGILMVTLAMQHRREQRDKRERELQTLALSAFATNGGPPLPRPGIT